MSPYRAAHLQSPNCGDIPFFPDKHYVIGGSPRLPKSHRSIKSGPRTDKSPNDQDAEVIWTCDTSYIRDTDTYMLEKDAAVARRAAVLAGGFRCVVIRAREHNFMHQRDEYGTLITTYEARSGRDVPNTVPSDWHMTVIMGESFQKLQIHGHLFLYPSGDNQGELLEERPQDWRKHGSDRTQPFEFWTLPGAVAKDKETHTSVMA